MKRWKKIIHNCPYLAVLFITWLFITAGGIALMIYRDYSGFEPDMFWTSPFFAVIMEEEINDGTHAKLKERKSAEAVMAIIAEDADTYIDAAEASSEMKNNIITNVIGETIEEFLLQVHKAQIEREEEPEEEIIAGETQFTTYTPVEVNSIYYSDAGKVALTTDYPYVTVGEEYFDDAVFFGDSRTLGISDYAGLNSDFFCENGMTIYKLFDEKGVMNQETKVKTNLNQVLQEKKYGKIYIMLGMNELGYRDTAYFLEQYGLVLEKLRQLQPQAVIFLQANLHVSRKKDNPATEFNNININDKNAAIATLANGTDVIYLDINPLFTDNDGYLNDDLTFDGVHLHADGYIKWKNFLMEHGVVREDE